MSLFPFLDQENENITEDHQTTIPTEYEINFETGELTGRVVSGKEAIKMWIFKVLRTNRYRHMIYSWDYGIELEDLINKPFDRAYIESEAQRYICEALMVNNHIKDVNNFNVSFEGTWLTCNFNVITEFGEVNISDKYSKL